MRQSRIWVGIGALAVAAATAFVPAVQAADVMLRSQSALPRNHDLTKGFLSHFIEPVKQAGKAVAVDYLGGPEINSASNAPAALRRGGVDMLHSPAAYYSGTIPQGMGLMATNQTPDQVRANGGMDILQGIWGEKLNAHILAWGESGAQFYLYFVDKPRIGADGVPDLKGLRMRTTGAYRAILGALGATQVQIPVPEVYTGLQRGVVNGLGWPNTGLESQGIHTLVKYRVDPPFYHLANLVLVNLDKWKALTKEQQDFLEKMARDYEAKSNADIATQAAADEAAFKKAGGQIIALEGAAGAKYLEIANESMWERMGGMLTPEQIAEIKPKLLAD
jgi:TRAP-type transport system periplasmic protein